MLRPGLQGLLEAALAGRFEIILAEALDRLSRDQADIAALYKRLIFEDVQIVTLAEGEITSKVTLRVAGASAGATQAVEAAGGTLTLARPAEPAVAEA